MVGVGAQQEKLFPFQRVQQRLVQRRNIQIRPGEQGLMTPVAPLALLIREGIEAGGVHVLHIRPLTVQLLKLGKVFLKELSAVLRARRCAHPGPRADESIVRISNERCSLFDLLGIGCVLIDIVPRIISGQKIRKACYLFCTSVEHGSCLLGFAVYSIKEDRRIHKYAPFCNLPMVRKMSCIFHNVAVLFSCNNHLESNGGYSL